MEVKIDSRQSRHEFTSSRTFPHQIRPPNHVMLNKSPSVPPPSTEQKIPNMNFHWLIQNPMRAHRGGTLMDKYTNKLICPKGVRISCERGTSRHKSAERSFPDLGRPAFGRGARNATCFAVFLRPLVPIICLCSQNTTLHFCSFRPVSRRSPSWLLRPSFVPLSFVKRGSVSRCPALISTKIQYSSSTFTFSPDFLNSSKKTI